MLLTTTKKGNLRLGRDIEDGHKNDGQGGTTSFISMVQAKRLAIQKHVPETRVQDVFVKRKHRAGDNNVGQGEPLPDEVSPSEQVGVQVAHGLLDALLCAVGVLLVVGHDAHDRVDPRAGGGKDFGVGEGQPLEDLGLADLVGTAAELVVGDEPGDGVALGEANAVLGL